MNRILWPSFVFLIIALCLTGTGSLIHFALNDSSFAVEPDYYSKAVAWDSTARQLELNRALAWQCHLSATPSTTDTTITLTLTDRAGVPQPGATITSTHFPNARATQRHTSSFTESTPGTYHLHLTPDHPGLWHFRLHIQLNNNTFTHETDLDLSPEILPK